MYRAFSRVGVVGAVAVAATVALSGVSAAEPGSSGSLGSSGLGSSSGSVSSGSVIPEPFRTDPGPPPALRDIAAPEIRKTKQSGQAARYEVDSPALRRTVTLDVLVPVNSSASSPTLYMLDGVSASDNKSGWMGSRDFFADKNVNVVMLNGGRASLYTDWAEIDPVLGLNKWETFITKELPPLIDSALHTNGVNAIAGTSMGAQAAMMLAQRNPDLYTGVVGFSGCYSTTDSLGRLSIQLTTTHQSGDPANVWGAFGNKQWAEHDSVLNAEALRGKHIYMSAATGKPGVHENAESDLFNTILVGGTLEAGSNQCTQKMDRRLEGLGIAATVDYEPTGVHDWPYWRDQLPKAWPTLAAALGLPTA